MCTQHKQTQTMNLALKLVFNQQQQSVFRPLRLAEDAISCSEYYYICECTTRTNVPENDCIETKQCPQLGDYLRVKRTLVAVKTWPMYHLTTDVPESDCDCKSEQ